MMDEIDTRQQEEITALQKRDIAHDKDLEWIRMTMKTILFAFTIWVIASSTIIFILIDKLDKYFKP